MKPNRLFCLLLLCAMLAPPLQFIASAQPKTTTKYVLKGEVRDTVTGSGIEYTTVAILDAGKKVVNMAAADGTGKFTIEVKEQGEFSLSLTSMGFSSSLTPITVDGSPIQNLGTFYLTSGIELGAVTVTAQKPLISVDADKLTYSVETDPEAQTGTLVEILRKVPQLSVDAEDNVLLNGQSNFKVLVNGKTSQLYSNNFKDVIRSMPASSIKNIEVITNPSTKYEAEGVGGIINIITSRKTVGYSGRIGVNYSSFNSYSTNGYIAAQAGKFNFSVNLFQGNFGNAPYISTSNRENFLSNDARYINTEGVTGKGSRQRQIGANVEASYEIDSLNLITLAFWGYDGNYKYKNSTLTSILDSDRNPVQEFENISSGKQGFGSISGSLDYQKLFMKPDKSLTFSYKLERDPNSTESTNEFREILNYTPRSQSSSNKATGTEHTLQVDYYDPLTKKHQIEAGVKYILRQNISDTDIKVRDGDNDQWVVDNSRLNDMDYNQHIFGAYGGYLYKLQKFSAKAGLRAEATWNDGTAKTAAGKINFDNTQFNVVPYVNFSYMINASNTVRLSYTQRLQRPGIWYLNPYVNDNDPLNISFGNPDLKSVVSHSFATNYNRISQKWNLFIGATASFANNDITQITTVASTGVSESTYENIGKNQNYRLNGSFSYRLGVKFSVNLNFNAGYSIIEAAQQNLSNEGFNYGGNAGVNVGLWKDASFRANGGFNSANVSLQGTGSKYFYTSMGLSQRLFKRKVDINLSVSNPFNRYQTYSSTRGDSTFHSYSKTRYESRRFSAGVGYRFGKTDIQAKKVKRGINNDDKMNGGGQSSGGAPAQ